jgi:sulfopyruvate decarboxylase subunit beta
MAERPRMRPTDALVVVRDLRRDHDVVVATMAAARDWMAMGSHPLDFIFVPSCMGHATSLGLGLALAQPQRRVIVLNGDGSMLMNLGSLVTITAAAPANLTIILLDNGAYEVTGAQPTPGAPDGRGRGDAVDFEAIARGCGFLSVSRFSDAGHWRRRAREAVYRAGPTFVLLDVELMANAAGPRSPGPAPARARRFMAMLRR